MKLYIKLISTILFILLLNAFLCSCATKQTTKVSDKRLILNYGNSKNKDIWPSKELKDVYKKYWINIYEGNIDACFDMQAPHIKNIIKKNRYVYFTQHAQRNKLNEIRIKKIKKNTKYNYDIIAEFVIQKDTDKIVKTIVKDRWILLDQKWFHVVNNPLFFHEIS